ncbi:DUF6436 domain-containing protein [Catenovulum maritimum]|uniref:DUF6436 domain-containing protein n=1 Tax=Catenovulum maritimum TaxID=1513271 RepID=UPI00122E855A|nr:DUF6436 domain-containing protein [Catenovulum maritimum]
MRSLDLGNAIIGGVIFIWLFATGIAFYFFSQSSIEWFDAKGQLLAIQSNQTLQSEYETKLADTLIGEFGQLNNRVFHISDEDCSCNRLAEPHKAELDSWFKDKGFQTSELPLAVLKSLLPASPAVIVFDKNGQLTYLGPYSSGYLCNKENSVVELAVAPSLQIDDLPAVINSQAQGCFCINSPS